MIINEFVDLAGKHRITWQASSGRIYLWKFAEYPSEEKLLALEAEQEEYNDIIENAEFQMNFEFAEYLSLIENLVFHIKENPTITATQFNTYLSRMSWVDGGICKFFIIIMAKKLAMRFQIDIDALTEAQVFNRVRDFIVDTPARRLKKIIFNLI